MATKNNMSSATKKALAKAEKRAEQDQLENQHSVHAAPSTDSRAGYGNVYIRAESTPFDRQYLS